MLGKGQPSSSGGRSIDGSGMSRCPPTETEGGLLEAEGGAVYSMPPKHKKEALLERTSEYGRNQIMEGKPGWTGGSEPFARASFGGAPSMLPGHVRACDRRCISLAVDGQPANLHP